MTTQLFKNNAKALLDASIDNEATSITLDDASLMPDIGQDEFYLLTLIENDRRGIELDWEIVKATNKSGNTLTVERGQEGTTARSWDAQTAIELRITAQTMNNAAKSATWGKLRGNITEQPDLMQALSFKSRALIVTVKYANRDDLRSANPVEDDLIFVESLGLFAYKTSSDEPDDDETCFKIPSKGAWLLQNPHFDLINSYLIGGGQMTTTASYDVTTTAANISSFGAVTQTFENNIGVQDGDTFIVLPNIEVDSSLSFRAYSDFYRRIKLEVRNNINSTVSLPAGKVLKVVKYVI